jgi:hypothetical protein
MAESAARYSYLCAEDKGVSDDQVKDWVTTLAWKGLRGITDPPSETAPI